MVATRSTGFDHIDLTYCKEHNITVCNVPEYGSRTVAEYTFALLLTVSRRMYDGIEQSKKCDFDHTRIQGIDLFGKTLGVIGLGKIGIEVVKIANGFGMKVLVNARKQDKTLSDQFGFTYATLESTHHTININNVMLCKPGTILINTARGGLIQTEAILLGLEKGILKGVGLDVLEEEKNLSEEAEIIAAHPQHSMDFKTLCIDHVLIHHPKVVVTPHNAFNSHEALVRIVQTTMDNIDAFMKGAAANTVAA
jgi:D-lactate dehydrogenase